MIPPSSSSTSDASLADAPAVNLTLERAAQGDEEAWRQLVKTYAKRVHGLIYRQCSDGDLAQEITQATFVQVVQHLKEYRERGRFEPWLFRIAMNKLRDEMRRCRRQARTFGHQPGEGEGEGEGGGGGGWGGDLMSGIEDDEGFRGRGGWTREDETADDGGEISGLGLGGGGGNRGGGGAEQMIRQEEIELLRQAVAKLSPADRRIIELRHTAGLGFAEIAQTLGQPLGTVLARGHRALAKLKQLLTAVQAAED